MALSNFIVRVSIVVASAVDSAYCVVMPYHLMWGEVAMVVIARIFIVCVSIVRAPAVDMR